MKPLALDLCCGKGGWAKGLISAGWDVVGVDVEEAFRADYPGRFYCANVCWVQWPDCPACDGTGNFYRHDADGDFLRCDECNAEGVMALADAPDLIVASPPCQEFSCHDQPWTRKRNPPPPDTSIWKACESIAAVCGAPLILENVRGAQRWMGSAKWHCGPYYLWGDVPALMPKFRYRHKESRSSTAVAERAEVPFDLAVHIGQVFHPGEERCA